MEPQQEHRFGHGSKCGRYGLSSPKFKGLTCFGRVTLLGISLQARSGG